VKSFWAAQVGIILILQTRVVGLAYSIPKRTPKGFAIILNSLTQQRWTPGWKLNHYYTTQQVYRFLSNSSLANKPRTKDDYSNIGLGMLGQALSLKAGMPLDQLIKDRILNVLGMNSTGMAMNATGISIAEDIKSRFAKGHMAGDLVFLPQAVRAAGAMYSTVNDLLKYLSANMGLIGTKLNSAMDESHLIRHPFVEIQPTFIDSSGHKSPGHEYIGSVWLIGTDLGRQVVWHNAGIDGYSGIIGFNPAKQTGLAILCSCYFTDVPPIEMINTAMTFLRRPVF